MGSMDRVLLLAMMLKRSGEAFPDGVGVEGEHKLDSAAGKERR